ncbi:MAG: redoxin domain-containing protein [Candidatus Rokubacteria bacterium]|nr:redoxin domain-containing protein [Candidatus Rokubacteria bacterium]
MLSIRWTFVATALLVLLAGALARPAAALEVGQKAPDFALPAATGGKPVKLSELTAKGPVVVYTFIQAFTAT